MTETTNRQTILVVDDDVQVRRLLCRVVEAAGYGCDEASSVEEARTHLAGAQPALILLDVHMPGESGLSLARELAGRHPAPAVVMVSGADDPEVAAIALDTGAYGYLTKPFKRNEVTIALDNGLRRRRLEDEARAHRAILEDRVVERTATAHEALARLRVAHEETVLRLSKAVEYRDPETGAHIERMSHYCGLLATRFGLDADTVRVASRLHDVGKIAVADSILLKPGALTPEERVEVERHAEIGYQLLQGSRSELLDIAAIVAWTHHERFDGTGYPRGLAGEDIPLVGRIAGVADVFDALTTDRVYRPAMPLEEAIAILVADRGKHFDPEVLDVFLDELDAVKAIIARFDGDGEPAAPTNPEAPAAPAVLTLQEAAAAIGVSASTMRRLADDGRIASARTTGGHRRFPLEAVRRYAGENGNRPALRALSPPEEALATLAERLSAEGADMTARAVRALYRGASPGWFGAAEAEPAVRDWRAALVRSCRAGNYQPVIDATEVLMRRAYLQSATLLERHGFLERFRDAALRALAGGSASQDEMTGTRHLFAALQQSVLERYS
jgi:putative two-component system response regulator